MIPNQLLNSNIELVNAAKECFINSSLQEDRNRNFEQYHMSIQNPKEKSRFSVIYDVIGILIKEVKELEKHDCFKSDQAAYLYLAELLPKSYPQEITRLCFDIMKPYLKPKPTRALIEIAQNIIVQTQDNLSVREEMRLAHKLTELHPDNAVLFDNINFLLDYFISHEATFATCNEEELLLSLKDTFPSSISNDLIQDCFRTINIPLQKPRKQQNNSNNSFWNTNSRAQFERIIKEVLPLSINEEARKNRTARRNYVISPCAFQADPLGVCTEPPASFTPVERSNCERMWREKIKQHEEQKAYFQSEKMFYSSALPLFDAVACVYDYVFRDKETLQKFSSNLNNKAKIIELFAEGGINLNVDGYESEDILLQCVEAARKEINYHSNFVPPSKDETRDAMLARMYFNGFDR